MPGTYQFAHQVHFGITHLKGVVESRAVGTNKFLSKDHEASAYCVTGGFGADPTKPNPDDANTIYGFWFWTFDGVPHPLVFADLWVDLPPSGIDCVHTATAWYLLGGGDPTDKTGVGLMSFNMSIGAFAGESPVAAPGDLVGATSVSTVEQGWQITAKDFIGSGNQTQPFHHWWLSGNNPQAKHDKSLTLAQGDSSIAVAFYGQDQPGDPGPEPPYEIAFKPSKDALAEVKSSGYDVANPVDFSIYVRILDRLDRLEQSVHGGRAFITSDERPNVGMGSGDDETRRGGSRTREK